MYVILYTIYYIVQQKRKKLIEDKSKSINNIINGTGSSSNSSDSSSLSPNIIIDTHTINELTDKEIDDCNVWWYKRVDKLKKNILNDTDCLKSILNEDGTVEACDISKYEYMVAFIADLCVACNIRVNNITYIVHSLATFMGIPAIHISRASILALIMGLKLAIQ